MPPTKRGESSKSVKKPAKSGVSAATKRKQARRKKNSKTLTLVEMARNQPPLRMDRPAERKIIRWNAVLDREVLMAIVHQANYRCEKLPWHEISLIMGRDISEGSIVQHVAKIRLKHSRNGYPVPPPLSRVGGILKVGSMKPEIQSMNPGVKPKPRLEDYKTGTGIPDFMYALGKGKGGQYVAYDDDDDCIVNLDSDEEDLPPQRRQRASTKKAKNSDDEDVIRAKDISDIDTESSDEEGTTDASDEEKKVGAGLPCLTFISDKSTNSNNAVQQGIATAEGHELVGRLSGGHSKGVSAGRGPSILSMLNTPFKPKDNLGHQAVAAKEIGGPTGYNPQHASVGQHQNIYATNFSHANPVNFTGNIPYAQHQVGAYPGNNMAMPQGYNMLQMGDMTSFPSGNGGFQPIGFPSAEQNWFSDDLSSIPLDDSGMLPFEFDNVGNAPQGFVEGELDYSLYNNNGSYHPLEIGNSTQSNVNSAGKGATGVTGGIHRAPTIMRLSSILNTPQSNVYFTDQVATGGVTGGTYGAPAIMRNATTTGYFPEGHALAIGQVHTDNADGAYPCSNSAAVKTPVMPPPVEHTGASWNISPETTSSFSGTAVSSDITTINPKLLQPDVPEEPEMIDDFELSTLLAECEERL